MERREEGREVQRMFGPPRFGGRKGRAGMQETEDEMGGETREKGEIAFAVTLGTCTFLDKWLILLIFCYPICKLILEDWGKAQRTIPRARGFAEPLV